MPDHLSLGSLVQPAVYGQCQVALCNKEGTVLPCWKSGKGHTSQNEKEEMLSKQDCGLYLGL